MPTLYNHQSDHFHITFYNIFTTEIVSQESFSQSNVVVDKIKMIDEVEVGDKIVMEFL